MKFSRFELAALTTDEVRAVCASPPTAVLVPSGSVEPHGPHLPLGTDSVISCEAAKRAAAMLMERGVATYIAPIVAYGVTDFSVGFAGAIGVPAEVLTAWLGAIAARFRTDGWSHVCFVSNHLEPAHDAAVRKVLEGSELGRLSVACPLTRRWGRTLSEEFKRGNCHAGRYETSLALASDLDVRPDYAQLPGIETSLSDGIRTGKTTFLEMGLSRAYTGAPAEATREEGLAMYERLAEMIVGEVLEGLAAAGVALPEP